MKPGMLTSLLLAAMLCLAASAADTPKPDAKPAAPEKKPAAKGRPGRDPVVFKHHDRHGWGEDADLKPDPAQLKAVYDSLRITQSTVSSETVRAGEVIDFTWKLSMETSEPLAVPPWIERNELVHHTIGGIQHYIEKVTGSQSIPPLDREGTRARQGPAYADTGTLLFLDQGLTKCEPPVEFRDVAPGPAVKLRRKVTTLPYAFLPPKATFTLTRSVDTKGFTSGTYVETLYYFDLTGRIIDQRQIWFTVR